MKQESNTVKKWLRAGILAGAALFGANTAAHAQSRPVSPGLLNAEVNVAEARLRAQVASCNNRQFSRTSRVSDAIANAAEARACRADAEADYYYDIARIAQRNGDPRGTQFVQQALNARVNYYQLEYQADITRCNTRLADTFNGRGRQNFGQFLNNSSRAGSCQANAQYRLERNLLSAQRQAESLMRRR